MAKMVEKLDVIINLLKSREDYRQDFKDISDKLTEEEEELQRRWHTQSIRRQKLLLKSADNCRNYQLIFVLTLMTIFWKMRLSEKEVGKQYLEFAIAFLQRSYEIKEKVTTIDDQLVYKILNSTILDELPDTRNYENFFLHFLTSARSFDYIDTIVTITKELFARIFNNKNIPQDDKLRERSALFICHIFRQLTVYYIRIASKSLSFGGPSKTAQFNQKVLANLSNFMDYLLEGLAFDEICIPAATEFCVAMENHPSVFINALKQLPSYLKLLEVDNITVMTIALKSLNRLFASTENKHLLFFFSHNTYSFVDENGGLAVISINDMLYQLAMQRNENEFTEQILNLFIMISQLNPKDKFLTLSQRKDIYAAKITVNNEKVFAKLIDMMKQYENNPLIALIETLNAIHASDEFVEDVVTHLYTSRKYILDTIDRGIVTTLNDNPKCYRACQILLTYHKLVPDVVEKKMNLSFTNFLCKAMHNEFIFGSLCDYLVEMKEMSLLKWLAYEKRTTELVGILFEAFYSFEKPKVLEKIMKVLKRLKVCALKYLKEHIPECKTRIYDQFVEIEAKEIAGNATELIEPSVIKLNLLFENNFNLTDYFEFDTLFIINCRRLENSDDFSFVQVARFQTTLIKFSFNFMVKRMTDGGQLIFPLTLEKLMTLAADLRVKLTKFITNSEFNAENVSDVATVLSCFFELHHTLLLRPLLIENNKRVIQIQQPRMDQNIFNIIIKCIEERIKNHDQSNSWESLEKCEADYINRIINSLSDFIKSFSHYLNYSSTFGLIYHYTNETFRSESLERLLLVLSCKHGFAEILGLTIMNFDHKNESLMKFAAFVTLVNKFIMDEKKHTLHFETAAYVIEALPDYIKKLGAKKNRLSVLQNILLFTPKILKLSNRIALENLVSLVIEGLELTTEEKSTVDFFAVDIKAKQISDKSKLARGNN